VATQAQVPLAAPCDLPQHPHNAAVLQVQLEMLQFKHSATQDLVAQLQLQVSHAGHCQPSHCTSTSAINSQS
jgi:hypothetical protein